jgi:hypothetical protein
MARAGASRFASSVGGLAPRRPYALHWPLCVGAATDGAAKRRHTMGARALPARERERGGVSVHLGRVHLVSRCVVPLPVVAAAVTRAAVVMTGASVWAFRKVRRTEDRLRNLHAQRRREYILAMEEAAEKQKQKQGHSTGAAGPPPG